MIEGRELLEVRAFLRGLPGEASERTRTSLAYYAAFHEALAYSESLQTFRRTRSVRDHADVVKAYSAIDVGIALNLANLRKLRNSADYDLNLDHEAISKQALWATNLVQLIFERLDHLRDTRAKPENAENPQEDR